MEDEDEDDAPALLLEPEVATLGLRLIELAALFCRAVLAVRDVVDSSEKYVSFISLVVLLLPCLLVLCSPTRARREALTLVLEMRVSAGALAMRLTPAGVGA